jgi:hypothetical protein
MPYQIKGQRTVTRAFSAIVRAADPNFDEARRREPEYEFHGNRTERIFYSDIRKRWPYNANPSSPLASIRIREEP